jgi:hypothetical protein
VILALATGCASYASYAKEQQAQLEAAFPPGKITRTQVHSRIGEAGSAARPTITAVRPNSGWPDGGALDCERRTGKRVVAAEYWVSPCGGLLSLTLCHDWFYFDDADVLACVSERRSD